jgi:uncharacterized heparinase superfamily protein
VRAKGFADLSGNGLSLMPAISKNVALAVIGDTKWFTAVKPQLIIRPDKRIYDPARARRIKSGRRIARAGLVVKSSVSDWIKSEEKYVLTNRVKST